MLQIDNAVNIEYQGTKFGIMVVEGIKIQGSLTRLNEEKNEIEVSLQNEFAGKSKQELRSLPVFSEYHTYYKRFKKTYHVLHQLESVANKKRSLPNGNPVVQAMFMAEVKNWILTAGYDLKGLESRFMVQLADGESSFVGMGNQQRTPPLNDILFKSSDKMLGSIICGPDHSHRIVENTSDALFAAYGVPGINSSQIEKHFNDIAAFVQLFSPDAEIKDIIIL